MHAEPLELTLDLQPRARFDAIDVRDRAARLHGDVLDAYPRGPARSDGRLPRPGARR
jgi:hypothetical protein